MGTTPAKKPAVRILSASTDAGLNQSRALLLREHGFEVKTCESVENATRLIEEENFDVLIFGSTLSRDGCWRLAEAFRKRHAAGRIIEILPSPWSTPRAAVDATVIGSEEPAKLVASIQRDVA